MTSNEQSENGKHFNVVIIGLGVSSLPLVKLLEAEGANYAIFSLREFGVWNEIDRRNENFDLVSTIEATNYSWWDFEYDFPFYTAKQYFSKLQDEITPSIRSKIQKVQVSYAKLDSHKYAIYSGQTNLGTCDHLVTSIGLQPTSSLLDDLDESLKIKNSVVEVHGFCDTTNMYISRLMLGNNKVYLRCNHFNAFDKILDLHPLRASSAEMLRPFDQYEFFGSFFEDAWMIQAPMGLMMPYFNGPWIFLNPQKKGKLGIIPYLNKEIMPGFLHSLAAKFSRWAWWPHPGVNLELFDGLADNEQIFTKYWPADAYFKFFDNPKWKSYMIENRIFLNDIYYFIKLGKVELRHATSEIDYKADRTFKTYRARVREIPHHDAHGAISAYSHKSALFGIWDPKEPNHYVLGSVRPITGGFGSMAELESTYIHQLITSPMFRKAHSLEQEKWTRVWADVCNSTSSVYSGMHCEILGRATKCSPSRSWCKLNKIPFDFGPCNALRYRMTGPYRHPDAIERYRKYCEWMFTLDGVPQLKKLVSLNHVHALEYLARACQAANFLMVLGGRFPTLEFAAHGSAFVCLGLIPIYVYLPIEDSTSASKMHTVVQGVSSFAQTLVTCIDLPAYFIRLWFNRQYKIGECQLHLLVLFLNMCHRSSSALSALFFHSGLWIAPLADVVTALKAGGRRIPFFNCAASTVPSEKFDEYIVDFKKHK